MNRAAVKILGGTRERIIGRSIDDFFSEADSQLIPVVWTKFIRAGDLFGTCKLKGDDAEQPMGLAVDSVTNKIYLVGFGPRDRPAGAGTFGVMDGATNSIVNVTDPNASSPVLVAVNPVTDRI